MRLPNYVAALNNRLTNLEQSITKITDELVSTQSKLQAKNEQIDNLDNRFIDLQHKILTLAQDTKKQSDKSEASITINGSVADNHDFDMFYKKFEDAFRGKEEIIKERIAEHVPLFTNLPDSLIKKPVIDIGCGRGEFLKLMKENGIKAVGIDMNEDMVNRVREFGLEAIHTDALSYLKDQPTASLSAVTGFHIVEHIPFESLMVIFSECYRTIDRGGFVLFETPNPRSLSVGANTFYCDPSHQRPIPAELLSFMLEYTGFKPEIILLHHIRPELASEVAGLHDVYESVYGFADYAVIGRKN